MENDWITDRRPTEADGDKYGIVVVAYYASKFPLPWILVGEGMAWQQSSHWQPPTAPKPALAVGQRWRRRDREVVTIGKIDRDHPFGNTHPFWVGGTSYTPEGYGGYLGALNEPCDLIELISEPPASPLSSTTTPDDMADKHHPITPPPELIREWAQYQDLQEPEELWRLIATKAARWGADQQLEADCEWLTDQCLHLNGSYLRSAMRPKPPSLKEEALAELEEIMTELHDETGSAFTASAIRRALKALPND